MKATLEFNLDDRRDARKHLHAIKAEDLFTALYLIFSQSIMGDKVVDSTSLLKIFDDLDIEINEPTIY